MLPRCAFAIFLVGLWPGAARGDERRPYAGVSAMLSTQATPEIVGAPSIPFPGVGGTAIGVAVEAGGFLSRIASIAFEASIPFRFTSVQETDYFSVFLTENRHRDMIFSGLFHFHLTKDRRVRALLAAGPSVVREDTLQRTAYQIGPSVGVRTGNFGPYGPESSVTSWTVGLTGGGEVTFQAGRHLSIVPQIRIHWIARARQGDGASGLLGLAEWVVRPAVGVRASF